MSIKFKENYDFRRLDFAYPREAIDAVAAVEMKYIKMGVPVRGIQAGPMFVSYARVSGTMSERIMLIDSEHADAFIADLQAACEPFEAADEDFGNFGKETVDE